jgi:hypothetical protein
MGCTDRTHFLIHDTTAITRRVWSHSLTRRSLLYNKHTTDVDEDTQQGRPVEEEYNMEAKDMAAS